MHYFQRFVSGNCRFANLFDNILQDGHFEEAELLAEEAGLLFVNVLQAFYRYSLTNFRQRRGGKLHRTF